MFFFLEKKEPKIQGERPTSINPAEAFQNSGSLSFAKTNRTITNVCSSLLCNKNVSLRNKSAYIYEISGTILFQYPKLIWQIII